MGNRAIITFDKYKRKTSLGIYLHWNGGRESIEAFLKAAKDLEIRDPCTDSYGITRLIQIIGNYFGGNASLGIGHLSELDNSDNGIFVVGNDFSIIEGADYQIKEFERRQKLVQQVYEDCVRQNKTHFTYALAYTDGCGCSFNDYA